MKAIQVFPPSVEQAKRALRGVGVANNVLNAESTACDCQGEGRGEN